MYWVQIESNDTLVISLYFDFDLCLLTQYKNLPGVSKSKY